jgi:drug/metabolite transporter (DMT)-like permease
MSRSPQSSDHVHGGSARDYLQLNVVVLAWGFTAILGKLIVIPALQVTVWRTALAAMGLAMIALARGIPLRVPPRSAIVFLGTGALVGWHWALFFLSARLSTASVCLAALPTGMLWCSLIEPLMNGTRRWSRAELFTGVAMVGAVWIIYRFEFTHWLGFTVGLASAFFAALFGVINKHLTAHHSPVILCGYQMTGACAACLVLLPLFGAPAVSLPSTSDLLWLLVLSQVCTVGAYIGYLDVLRRVSVFTVNVVYNLEPVYGILLAALIFGEKERMSGGFYLGASIIVASVVALPVMNHFMASRRAVPEDLPPTSGLP